MQKPAVFLQSGRMWYQEIKSIPQSSHETFPDNDQILNAALLGRGIALLPFNVVYEEIASGNLEYANPEPIPSPMNCYFMSPADARPNGDLIAFRDWLIDSLKTYRAEENIGKSDAKG